MRCDRCGRESPGGFRFCGSCGAPLAGTDAVATTRERKLVSALFCDLVGFTARAERMDPEEVHRLLVGYYATVREVLERFGGSVAKYIGDAVFAVFGAPRAHEDDPVRAVRAALATLDAVAELNARDPELDLHVHIGVTTGEALVTLDPDPERDEGLAWGDLLNTASRIEAAAGPDAVLVDEPTYRATRHAIELEDLGSLLAKGKAEPVPVWRALAPRRRSLDVRASAQALVDRVEEMRTLVDALDEVHERRVARFVALVGDPGVGKSFLVHELVRRSEARARPTTWRLGRSPPYPEGVAFWALGDIVKGQSGVLETDDAATAAAKLRRSVAAAIPTPGEAARVESQLLGLLGLGATAEARADDREAAFAAWRQYLEAHARRRPLAVVFEDLHWADDGLLDFVEHLVAWSRDAPLLIVATGRPELLERRAGWGKRPSATMLAPLSTDHTRALVAAAAADAITDELSDAVVRHASGNPLYAVEFVSMLVERGLGDARAEELPLPDSLRGIIAARLDLLSADDKATLHAGAVVGRSVWPGALSAILERPRRWVSARLRALEAKELLVRARRSSLGREPEFRFRHALIRDVAYLQIPRARRGEIHRRTAEWLESLSTGRAVDRAELLARHWLSAYELAPPTGQPELLDATRRAQATAGERALGLHASASAARYFETALELWPPDDPERPWLLFRLGRARYYADLGGGDVLAEARDGLLAGGNPGAAAEAEALLGILSHHEGRGDLAAEHFDRAADLVADLDPSRSKAEVLVDVANYHALASELEQVVRAATEALAIAQSLGLRELEASALSIMGFSRGLAGDAAGRDDLWRSIAITEEIGSPLAAHTSGLLADLEAQMGNLRACFELRARARRHAESFGHAGFVRWLEAERVGDEYWGGRWDDAMRRADAFLAEVEGGRPHFMDGYCRTVRGRMRLARGDAEGALADAAGALQFAREAEDLQMLYPALALSARAHVMTEARDDGATLADELLTVWRSKVEVYPASSWAADLAAALVPLGRGDELIDTARRAPVPSRWLDAVVRFAQRDFDGAAAAFEWIGSRPDASHARACLAEALIEADRWGEALAALRAARAFYAEVDAGWSLRRIERMAEGRVAPEDRRA